MPLQLDVIFDGIALNDFGMFSSYNTFSGIGLATQGFIWESSGIWAQDTPYIGITTIWTTEYLPS